MDADWFVDPLGRFDGRYFDGDAWTDQVSDSGQLRTDPDWPSGPDRSEQVVIPKFGTQLISGKDRRNESDRRETHEDVPADRRTGERRQLDAVIVSDADGIRQRGRKAGPGGR